MKMPFITKERKDPADIAKEFTAATAEAEAVKKAEEPKKEEQPKAVIEEKIDEKPAQEGAEPSPAEEPVKKEADTDEEKSKKRNLGAEKRINELVGQIKSLKEALDLKDKESSARLTQLEEEKNELQRKAGIAPENKVENELRDLEKKRVKEYTEADKELPREERREMSRDEYEAWLLEDISAATDWKVRTELRKERERNADHEKLSARKEVDKIMKAQQISRLRVEARHPELMLDDVKNEMRAKGMDEKAIHEELLKTNPKYKIISDLLVSDKKLAEKVLLAPNGPELLEEEMTKRLSKTEKAGEGAVEQERIAALEAQIAEMQEELNLEKSRQERVDVGLSSKKGGNKMPNTSKDSPMSAERDKVLSMLGKKGYKMTDAEYADMVERRKNIRGADSYEHGEDRG